MLLITAMEMMNITKALVSIKRTLQFVLFARNDSLPNYPDIYIENKNIFLGNQQRRI